ncbi:MAG: hypothetical protein ABL958_20440, partial [Bdellovibrionia bacterium]
AGQVGVSFFLPEFSGVLGAEVKDSTLESVPAGGLLPGLYFALGPATLFGGSFYFGTFTSRQHKRSPLLKYELIELRTNAELWHFLSGAWGSGLFVKAAGGYSNLSETATVDATGAESVKRNYFGYGWQGALGFAFKMEAHTCIGLNYAEYAYDGVTAKIYSVDFGLLF